MTEASPMFDDRRVICRHCFRDIYLPSWRRAGVPWTWLHRANNEATCPLPDGVRPTACWMEDR